jgi:predicted PurR-regulated permease PerM
MAAKDRMSDPDAFPRFVIPDEEDIEAEARPQTDEDLVPSAPDVANVFLGGLFALALLAACYVAAAVVLPVVVAFVLMLVLQPAMRLLQRFNVPRGIAALLLILLFFGASTGIGALLGGPAANWAQKLPHGVPELQARLSFLSRPIAAFQNLMHRAESLANVSGQSSPMAVTMAGAGLSDRLIEGTRSVMSGLFETVLVLFFLLIAGDTFLRRLVEVLPRFKNKRQAVEIAQQIESDISAYLLTITL